MGKKLPTEQEHGVVLKKEIAVSYKEKKKRFFLPAFLEWCLAFAISFFSIECFITGYHVETDQRLFLAVTALVSLCFFVSFSLKKGVELCMVGEILLYGWIGYLFRNQIAAGLAIVMNLVMEKIEHYYGMKFGKYQVTSENQIYDTTVFLLFVSALLIGILIYLIKNRISIVWVLAITLFLVFSPEYIGNVPEQWCYTGYAVAMFAYIGSRITKQKMAVKASGWQSQMEAKVRLFLIAAGAFALVICSFAFSEQKYNSLVRDRSFKEAVQNVLKDQFNRIVKGNFYTGSVSGGIGFGELGEAEEIKYTKKVKLRLTVPEKEDGSSGHESIYLRGYLGSVYENNAWNGLSGEDAKKQKNLEEKYDMALEEYAGAAYYYLLGYKQFEKDAYEPLTTALWEKLKKQPAFLQPFHGNVAKQEMEQVSGKMSEQITIENMDETYGTVFTPYFSIGSLAEKDGKLSSKEIKNKGQYTWTEATALKNYLRLSGGVLDSLSEEDGEDYYFDDLWSEDTDYDYVYDDLWEEERDTVPENRMEEFWKELLDAKEKAEEKLGISVLNYEDQTLAGTEWGGNDTDSYVKVLRNAMQFYTRQQEYEEFVNQAYTSVSEEQKKVLLDQIKGFKTYDGDLETLREDILIVKEYLQQETSYTLSPGRVPEGKDFVNYFLFENKKGYCSHYASAATLFFRSMGIPARYVEGYLAKSGKFDYGTKYQGNITVNLTDENAHAWVEVYITGYGWIPIEVTPGYSTGEQVTTPAPTEKAEATATPDASKATPAVTQSTASSGETDRTVDFDFSKVKPFLFGILILAAVIGSIFFRRKWILFRREKQENSTDINVRAAFYYQRMEAILLCKKERKQRISLRDKIEKDSLKVETIEQGEWQQLLFVMNKYAFSKMGITLEEFELILTLYEKVLENIYKNSSGIKGLYYKFIKVI